MAFFVDHRNTVSRGDLISRDSLAAANRFSDATNASFLEVVSIRPLVRPSVRPSIRPSVNPSVHMSRVIFEGEKNAY